MFQPGQSGNPSGRPKGAKNKATSDLREKVKSLIDDNFENIESDLQSVEPKERLKFFIDLLRYVLPTLQSTELTSDFEQLTDDDLNKIVKELTES